MKPIGEFLSQRPLAALRSRGRAHARLQADFAAALPAWMDPAGIEVELAESGVLLLRAPPGQARMLAQLLPSLPAALAEHGVRTVTVRRRG